MPKSSIAAILQCKCPRCREGDVFAAGAFNLRRFSRMNERCPVCHVRLEPEPGFYQGAMYVSYAITVALITAVAIVLYFLFGDPSEWIYIGIVIGLIVLIAPLNYRYSRVLYLYWFGGIKFNPSQSH